MKDCLPATDAHMADAACCLQQGGLVVMPTETVYGLAADALNPAAVARIFETKARPSFDPLIVHVASLAQAQSLAADWSDTAQKLAEVFWPGPLTLVVAKAEHVPDLVTSGLPNVGLRWPAHPVAQQLIQASGKALAAPSANRFGSISPTRAEHAAQELGAHMQGIDRILDGGPCGTGVESTVVGLVGEPTLLRPGGLPAEAIEAVLGQPLARPAHAQNPAEHQARQQQAQVSPGMLDRHYAPRTPLTLLEADAAEPAHATSPGSAWLALPSDPIQAAAALFAQLRQLDNDPAIQHIFARKVAPTGLGLAINDRLTRAATPRK